MVELVIDRTFEGYTTEIQTVYGQLQNLLNINIEPAPDNWDRLFNVDFFIKVGDKYIGLQIKPVNGGIQLAELFKEHNLQLESHKRFTKEYEGKVFYIFSMKQDGKKVIANPEVVEEIKEEISKLNQKS